VLKLLDRRLPWQDKGVVAGVVFHPSHEEHALVSQYRNPIVIVVTAIHHQHCSRPEFHHPGDWSSFDGGQVSTCGTFPPDPFDGRSTYQLCDETSGHHAGLAERTLCIHLQYLDHSLE